MVKNGKPIRVAVFDANPETRVLLSAFIHLSPSFICAGIFENTNGILKKITAHRPGVVISRAVSGFPEIKEAVMKIKNHFSDIKILVQFQPCEEDHKIFTDVIDTGADGYIVDTAAHEQVAEAIILVREFGSYLCPQIAGTILLLARNHKEHSPGENNLLTPREHDVLELLVKGMSYKKIADELIISVSTVRTHIIHIYEKLQVHSKTEAVAKALEERMV
jgi:DNA-binding NarL/FixJ family response regulator